MSNEVYQIITDQIIEQLENNVIPWRKPWYAVSSAARNIISKKSYQGINALILNCLTPYKSPFWMTYKQAADLGGNIRKGEKGTLVTFWKLLNIQKGMENTAEESRQDKIPILRYYRIFNLEQTEGIPDNRIPNLGTPSAIPFSPIAEAERIIRLYETCPAIRHGGDSAYYQPREDYIQIPEAKYFDHPEEYYSTLFHECAHSTGHSRRLNREGIQKVAFGSATYSKEELIAEITATFLCSEAGIMQNTLNNSAAYIKGWLEQLKNDRTLVVLAAGAAQKAANYILHGTIGKEE